MSYIYKITNKVNNKVYIGYTSRDAETRFKEHCRDARFKNKNKLSKMTYLQKAIMKYGEKSFNYEEIYELSAFEDLNWSEIEKQFIVKYNSNIHEIGYNLTEGGDNPPRAYGELNVCATLLDSEFYGVLNLIKDNQLSFTEIAKTYKVCNDTIERINKGEIRFQEDVIYPIRKHSIDELKAIDVVKLLINTDLKSLIIAKTVGVKIGTVIGINTGKTQRNIFINLKFPIRDNLEHNKQFYSLPKTNQYLYHNLKCNNCNKYEKRALEICKDLINETDLKISNIAKKYKIGTSIVYQINLGNIYQNLLNVFVFPILNNKHINKNILDEIEAVETIPLIGK